MSQFYGRRWELLLDDEQFIAPIKDEARGIQDYSVQEFRIVFNVLIDFGGYTSYADIALYNLSTDTANKVIKKGKSISLRAGYIDTIDLIFKGNINNVLYERSGPDTITRIIARGGQLSDRQNINKTLGKNALLSEIITECVSAMGYKLEMNPANFKDVYSRGKVLSGDPRVQLDALAKTHDFVYTFEADRIVVIRGSAHRNNAPVVISQFNGMEGIPEITEVGADVSCRLNPKIKIGGRIDIQSQLKSFNFSNLYFQDIPEAAGTGLYRVFKLRHSGDSKGDNWTTKITGYR